MRERRFTVTEDHIKLIKAFYVNYNDYCEFGAPEIRDTKHVLQILCSTLQLTPGEYVSHDICSKDWQKV